MQDLARGGPGGQQRVVAEDVGIAEGGALFVVPMNRADGGVEVYGDGPAPGPAPNDHARLSISSESLSKLADMAWKLNFLADLEGRSRHDLMRLIITYVALVRSTLASSMQLGPGHQGVHQGGHPPARERRLASTSPSARIFQPQPFRSARPPDASPAWATACLLSKVTDQRDWTVEDGIERCLLVMGAGRCGKLPFSLTGAPFSRMVNPSASYTRGGSRLSARLGLDSSDQPAPDAHALLGEGLSVTGLRVREHCASVLLDVAGGGHLSLADLLAEQRPVVLVFVSARCGPCEALLPRLAEWQDRFHDRLTLAVVASVSARSLTRRLPSAASDPS